MLSSSTVHMTHKKAICFLFHHWPTERKSGVKSS